MSEKKLLLRGYYMRRTAKVPPVMWPPLAIPKDIEDAEQVEIFNSPGSNKKSVFLYVVWPDKFKYIVSWDEDFLKLSMPEKWSDIFKKKRKVWSEQLEKKLLKDARPNYYE